MINRLGEISVPKKSKWRISIPESITSNASYNGAIYGCYRCDDKSIYVFDTITFPKKDDSKRIGYIMTTAFPANGYGFDPVVEDDNSTADAIKALKVQMCGEVVEDFSALNQ